MFGGGDHLPNSAFCFTFCAQPYDKIGNMPTTAARKMDDFHALAARPEPLAFPESERP
jgi:hypothetical protein